MKKKINKICIIGLGYIGLPTGALLANKGYEVYGVDVLESVVNLINEGKIHIVEPELDVFVDSAVKSGNLKAGLLPVESDVFIIAVPTPFSDGYLPDLKYVISATKAIAPFIRKGNIIILESTSPVGTTEMISKILIEEGVSIDELFIAHCPERVLPGHVMRELIENDRIVGGTTREATEKVANFYRSFVSGQVLTTTSQTAEMCKLVENSFRDVNIAFANELSMICDKANINVWELIKLANRHPRVNILQPGPGVGGHCIAVDPWFIVSAYPNETNIIKQARLTNDYKSEWVIEKIKNCILNFQFTHNRFPKVAYLGLSFKPDIDDLRESPAVKIMQDLIKHYSEFDNTLIVEPNIKEHKIFKLTDLSIVKEEADIVVYLVSHKEFQNLNFSKEVVTLNFCGVIS
jgi:UDP-N-acetyl-D-mannosaminuronic acid dehydrogenase